MIIYEDKNIIIANKPKNILSCGENSLESKLQQADKTVRACHRLDRNTDGLIIFAKNDEAEQEIAAMLKNNQIKKIYTATVFGKPKDSAALKDFLFKDSKKSKVFVSKNYTKGAKEIITKYKTIERMGELSKLEVEILTGRTHQIRAHLAFYNLPILGDDQYGDFAVNKKYKVRGQELTCTKIVFPKLAEGDLLYDVSEKQFQCTTLNAQRTILDD